jgi:hypothetical protein
MELEGLGVPLHGRPLWVYSEPRHIQLGSGIPWEYIQEINYTMKLLIRGPTAHNANIETDWSCVWIPHSAHDWSCIATVIRSIGVGSCLLVLDHVAHTAPASFWAYLDGMLKEGRTVLTRIWIHSDAPAWIPDATFFPPLSNTDASLILPILHAMPARHNHGIWINMQTAQQWVDLLRDTGKQGLGIVLSDVQETQWTLFWHKPADSRPTLEVLVQKGSQWINAGTRLLQTHTQSTLFQNPQ